MWNCRGSAGQHARTVDFTSKRQVVALGALDNVVVADRSSMHFYHLLFTDRTNSVDFRKIVGQHSMRTAISGAEALSA
jgi:hypothetical protein